MTNQVAVVRSHMGRLGIILLAFWVLLQSLVALGVPLGQIAGAIGWLGLVTAICLLFGL